MKPPLSYLHEELDALAQRGLLRQRRAPRPPGVLSFCSNDYLGLAEEPLPPSAPSGAGAARLVAGDRPAHRALEQALATWLGTEDALLFSSGFAANLGLVSALARPGDTLVSDSLNHASIVDGCRLARAQVTVTPHLDAEAVDRALARRPPGGRAWVVSESYFSMDADSPDLPALRRACDAHGAALLLDEAHALGVFGPEGRGLAAAAGVVPDAIVGTLGKSFGLAGAFVAGSRDLITWLWNTSRPFVFSTGMSPAVCAAALARLPVLRTERDRAARTLALAAQLREGLARRGLEARGHGHVVPLVLGTPERAVATSRRLAELGIDIPPIRPPTVPTGTARLRIALTASHQETDVAALLDALVVALRP